jgi:hypothetical protein
MQEDLRTWFDTPEAGQEARRNRAFGHHIALQNNLVRRNMVKVKEGIKDEADNSR